VRLIGGDELAAWRKQLPKGWQRAVSRPLQARRPPGTRVGDDAGSFEVDVHKPLSPTEAHAQVLGHLQSSALRNREDFQAAVRQLRKWSPSLISHLTDEQAAQLLEEQWNLKVREAVQRVYHRTGRARELTIRIP